jgi:type I restriction enzyme S subunit
MANRIVKIEDICHVVKGETGITKAIPGEYPLVALSEERKTHNEYQFDCKAIIIPLVSSTGHGHASMKRIHYQEGKFALGSILCALIPKSENEYDPEYLYHILDLGKERIFVSLMKGMANVSLPMNRIKSVELNLPPYDEQVRLAKIYSEVSANFELLKLKRGKQQQYIKQLRQTILQLAVQGKLTAKWREENPEVVPASVLLGKIKDEKEQLIKEKKLPREKLLPKISETEKPFNLPKSWIWTRLGNVAFGFDYGTSSKSKIAGQIPVLRMGNIQDGQIDWKKLVFTDDIIESEKYLLRKNDILFNRTNSRELVGKTAIFNSNEKSIFAGYLVRFSVHKGVNPINTNYLMNSPLHREWCNEVKSDAIGQSNINAAKLRYFRYPLAPLAEQQAIVSKVNQLMAMCDELEKKIEKRDSYQERIMQAVVRQAI